MPSVPRGCCGALGGNGNALPPQRACCSIAPQRAESEGNSIFIVHSSKDHFMDFQVYLNLLCDLNASKVDW